MYISRNPAKSRPLSANVKRLMRLARASPHNAAVIKFGRTFSIRDLAFCSRQGALFMEASFMGLDMAEFAPLFMTSQIAGIFDVFFSAGGWAESHSTGNEELFHLMQIPMLLKSPATVVETLYWIEDIISRSADGENKSLVITRAYEAERLAIPPALQELQPNRDTNQLAYAYWLGYIYRCECLLHEESSRMVYGAFPEKVMREAFKRLTDSPLGHRDLGDSALDVCEELDRFLVETLWPAQKKTRERRQAAELRRQPGAKQRKRQTEHKP